MSLLGEAERRTEVSAQGEKPPHNSIGLNTSLANFGGGLSSECTEDERERLGCPTPETVMLPGTPALGSPWTLLAPGLHLAIFHTIIELCVLEKMSKITETGDHTNRVVFPFNSNCTLFNFQISISRSRYMYLVESDQLFH